MALAYDAVGPSASGATAASGTLTWSHTCTGASRVLIVIVTSGTDSATLAATYATVTMTSIAKVHSNNSTSGFVQMFGLVAPATGANNVVITGGGAKTGGSISFNGADQTTGWGSPFTGFGAGTPANVTLSTTTAGRICVGGICNGGGITSATSPSTSRFIANLNTSSAAGNGAGATSASTGSSLTMAWSVAADWYGSLAVEIKPAGDVAIAPAVVSAVTTVPARTVLADMSATATPAVAGATSTIGQVSFARYITGLDANCFIDQSGQPRLAVGDAAWNLISNAGRWNSGDWAGTFDTYLTARAAQGYTVVYTEVFGSTRNGGVYDNGNTFDNVSPFVSGGDPSTGLNDTFWSRVDYLLTKARTLGITVFLNLGGSWDMETAGYALTGKTSTQYQAFGTGLGNRYKTSAPNLVWMVADDYFGGEDTQLAALLTGIRNTGDTHVISIENYAESTSRKDTFNNTALGWGTSHAQFNFCYSYNVSYYGVEYAYAEASPLPVLQGDGYFYQHQGTTAEELLVRTLIWWALSSGSRGWFIGDEGIWQWPSNATTTLVSGTWITATTGHIRTAFESLAGWHLLKPDTSNLLVTAGRGTHASATTSGGSGTQYTGSTDAYVTASRTPDGSLAVIYMSHASSITIDQTKVPAGYTATWIDPVSGVTSSATPGATYTTVGKTNSASGPDWVLVLQGTAAVSATATPSVVSASTPIGATTVTAIRNVVITPAVAGAVSAVNAASVLAGVKVGPPVVAASASVGAVSLITGGLALPPVTSAAATFGAWTAQASSLAVPAVISSLAILGALLAPTGSRASPGVLALPAAFGSSVATVSSLPVPGMVAAVTTVTGSLASAGSHAAPGVASGVAAVASPALMVTAKASPGVLASVADMPGPSIVASGNITVAPLVIDARSTTGSPVIIAIVSALPAPPVTTAGTVVSSAAVTATASALPSVVAGTATLASLTVSAAGNILIRPEVLPLPASIPAAIASASTRANPGVTSGTAAITGPTMDSRASASAVCVAASATVGACQPDTGMTLQALAVMALATVPGAVAGVSMTAQPACLNATSAAGVQDLSTSALARVLVVACGAVAGLPVLSRQFGFGTSRVSHGGPSSGVQSHEGQ